MYFKRCGDTAKSPPPNFSQKFFLGSIVLFDGFSLFFWVKYVFLACFMIKLNFIKIINN